MKEIFINLKRFDVPKSLGGICPQENPVQWAEWIIDESVHYGLGKLNEMEITFLWPESLVITAVQKLAQYRKEDVAGINIGCQGVFRENVTPGGNFGAFTTNLPAAAAKNMGCTWSIIGHSEERKDKLGIISSYDVNTEKNEDSMKKAKFAVDNLINKEVLCALNSGINVLLCVGETAEEKGTGDFETQKTKIREVLRSQLETGLRGVKDKVDGRKIVIGYEPIWAIGPGKTPPGEEYIAFVSSYVKDAVKEMFGLTVLVVYGGGLKEENAEMISRIATIDGGLVGLTKFTGDIGFEPEGLKRIVDKYLK